MEPMKPPLDPLLTLVKIFLHLIPEVQEFSTSVECFHEIVANCLNTLARKLSEHFGTTCQKSFLIYMRMCFQIHPKMKTVCKNFVWLIIEYVPYGLSSVSTDLSLATLQVKKDQNNNYCDMQITLKKKLYISR